MPQGCLTGVVPRAVLVGPDLSVIWSRHHAREATMRSSSRILEAPEVLQMRQLDGGKNIFRMPKPMAAMWTHPAQRCPVPV